METARPLREKNNEIMVLLEGIELSTSPLPRECSTTELQQLMGLLPMDYGQRGQP